METGLVSVVIPSYNHRQYLGRAIDSVLRQSHDRIECIVIDDGSRDGSYEHFSALYTSDARVRMSSRENRGAHNTINEGLQMARGEFLTILNSDDTFAPQRLERLVAEARASETPFFAITALDVVDENDQPFTEGPFLYYQRVAAALAKGAEASAFWNGNIAMTTSNFFFSREVWEAVGPFRSLRYTHDWDWALRASERFGVRRIDAPLLQYRVHGSNTISEPDVWSHIAENAFIFAASLRRIPLSQQQVRTGLPATDIMACLMRNESFLPLSTLFVLGLGRSDEELLAALADGTLKEALRQTQEASGMEIDLMLSAGHLQQQVLTSRGRTGNQPSSGRGLPRLGRWIKRLLPL